VPLEVEEIVKVVETIARIAVAVEQIVLTVESIERLEAEAPSSPVVQFLRRIVEEPETIPIPEFTLAASTEGPGGGAARRGRRSTSLLDEKCHRDAGGSGLYACPCDESDALRASGTVQVSETCFSTGAKPAGMAATTVAVVAGIPALFAVAGAVPGFSGFSWGSGSYDLSDLGKRI